MRNSTRTLLLVAAVLLAVTAHAPDSLAAFCPCRIDCTCTFGTPGPDVINGTGLCEDICSLGGDDTVNAGGGDDFVGGGPGNDTINGGAGDDTLAGGDGDDEIDGGTGKDTILGGNGTDVCTNGEVVSTCELP